MISYSFIIYLYMVLLTLVPYLFQNSFQCFLQHFKTMKSSPYKLNPVNSSEHLALQTLLYPITPLVQVLYQLSSLTIVYSNLLFNSPSLTFLVPMSANCIPSSHHTVLWIIHSFPFITKCILLTMCLVCFVSLPLLAIHTDYLISNMMIGACSATTYVSLFIS